MFVNQNLSDALYWYQKKIGSYDQPQWEKKVDEKVLNEIHLNETKKVTKLKTELIDLDLIRGSAFSKNKPKQGLFTNTIFGIIRVSFLPFYIKWWTEQTNKIICGLLVLLYSLQLFSLFIYYNDYQSNVSNNSIENKLQNVPLTEVLTPLFIFFYLGILYSQISASISSHNRLNQNKLKANINEKIRERLNSLKDEHQVSLKKNQLKSSKVVKKKNKNKLKLAKSKSNKPDKRTNERLNQKNKLSPVNNVIKEEKPINEETKLINRKKNQRVEINDKKYVIDKSMIEDDVGFDDEMKLNYEQNNYSDELTEATSGEDCSPYSSISSNISSNTKLKILMNSDFNKKNDFDLMKIFKKERDDNNKKVVDSKKKKNYSDSENGSMSPTTPMKSLNDWPMINSENSSEDDEEDELLNEHKLEEKILLNKDKEKDNLKEKLKKNSLPDEIDLKNDSTDKVSCTIYKQNEWRKINLSMFDISSMVIKKVDTVHFSNEYFYLAIFFSSVFAFIPQMFRLSQICNSLNNTEVYDSKIFSSNNFDKNLGCNVNEDLSKSNNLSAFSVCSSSNTDEQVEFFNYFPLFVFNLMTDIFKNSIYSWQLRYIVFVSAIERFALSFLFFILLCVAERTYKERFLYAKYFCHLTSARRAKRNDLPHFRLNKVRNIKSWLSIRSYLKKHGPQQSVDSIVSTSFILAVMILTFLCLQLLRESYIFNENLYCYELVFCNLAIFTFIMRLIILGSKMNRKYTSNLSVLITEQINLYLQLEQKPHKKDKLQLAHSVLKLAVDLLKQLEVPFKISGFSANSYLYNITKVIVLSAFSAVLSEVLGFKLKLYKIKIKG